jgi:hypothetical protein
MTFWLKVVGFEQKIRLVPKAKIRTTGGPSEILLEAC